MPIRTLVVDDTITYRTILCDALAAFPGVEVAGSAPGGAEALQKMGREPVRLVLLDIHMPGMDGVETLRRIREKFPEVLVVMVSGVDTKNAASTIRALEMGAIDFIEKPRGADPRQNMERLKASLGMVLRMVELRVQTAQTRGIIQSLQRPAARPPAAAVDSGAGTTGPACRDIAVCAIGISTGGPEVLSKLVPALPDDLRFPVAVVQHMPPVFTRSLAESLAAKSRLRVVEARDGEEVRAGSVYIAPGGSHMVIRRLGDSVNVGITDGPSENSCKPSVDVLFRSAATCYPDKCVLAMICTGMGSDGLSGVRSLKRRSCLCVTQSEPSCVVYGMPKAIVEAGLSDLSLPAEAMAEYVAGISSGVPIIQAART